MGKKIRVTPEELKAASDKLQEFSDTYKGIHGQLKQSVGSLAEAWEGQDNADFVAQISEFNQELDDMAAKLATASQYLKQQSDNYVKVQDSNSTQVKTLAK